MEIKKYNHDGEALSTSIILDQSEVVAFREKARDVLTILNKDQEKVDVFMKNFKPESRAKSEIVEIFANTFTADELAILALCRDEEGIGIVTKSLERIVKGEFLTDYTHKEVTLEKTLIREEQGITDNPFENLHKIKPFL